MTATYNFISHADDWCQLPGAPGHRKLWRRPWTVFVSTCKSLKACGVDYHTSVSEKDGVTTIQVVADGTPTYRTRRKAKLGIQTPQRLTMQRCTTELLAARQDKRTMDIAHWVEMIHLTPGAENREVCVYFTSDDCKQQEVWVDGQYELMGHSISTYDGHAMDKAHHWMWSKRLDLIRQCRDVLAKGEASSTRHRTMARLTLVALGEVN